MVRDKFRLVTVPPFEYLEDDERHLYQQVADHVQARIEAGELRPGARLPNERGMCDEYGISIGTTRRAVALLRERGLVRTIPIKGTFVSR